MINIKLEKVSIDRLKDEYKGDIKWFCNYLKDDYNEFEKLYSKKYLIKNEKYNIILLFQNQLIININTWIKERQLKISDTVTLPIMLGTYNSFNNNLIIYVNNIGIKP